MINRRALFGAALGSLAVASLAACGGGAGGPDGRLRVAFPTGGAKESLDPHTSSLFVDQARAKALFDTLVGYADDMSVVPRLAESWESDATGTRWSIRLREARFHDGRPVTADDVLHSYRRIADPATSSPARKQFLDVDFAASRARSASELELVLHTPNFEFPSAWGAPAAEIVPAGTSDFTAPIGSGPFRFGSFQPGRPAVFTRFDGYWDGAAELPELEFVPINDESARVAALLSGQVHYIHDISANSAQLVQGDGRARLLAAPHGTMQAVALKVDRAPFDDPRLVRAALSGVDRRALVDVALSGHGRLGNDLFGKGLRHYPPDLPQRERDADRARSLVREAGAEGLAVELLTSTVDPCFESASALIAQQLTEIGLRVSPRVGPPETYFSDIRTSGVAALTRTAPLPLPTFLSERIRSGAGTGNYTGYRSPAFDSLFRRAMSAVDEVERSRLLGDAQRLARDESGLLVWGFSDWNVAVSASVSGVRAAPPNSLDWARFERASLG
ncbi:peptide/nickel transport system substrate-binding protein [Saccharopolyspora kobensis]|uniref:Peptide/nickel transport system substrate-binding protein n=1 Tax=Saccharopolyspora kobensis TaxID=146035 RepID=A0A1H5T4J7_9PSEU|nr:ABC transporter substrate-binding protein [Saccharopolyspora kobensis]SEF57674.1 peptide/nickel transport system substrate-binding protein [Saccharopolyspora kobensis]SFC50474.1 peptide/nickel transport system substrate-binding protein [Saccharopolyspora kobensis]